STALAVMVNGLTTITGFGCLLVAHHRGIWSLGLLLTIGSATSLAAALIVLPALIRLFGRAGGDVAEPTAPVDRAGGRALRPSEPPAPYPEWGVFDGASATLRRTTTPDGDS